MSDHSSSSSRPSALNSASFGSPASHHFKYNFLSSGSIHASQRDVEAFKFQRPSIMDATRSFGDGNKPSSPSSAIKQAGLSTLTDERIASGMGYGRAHPYYYRYVSKSQTSRAVPSSSSPILQRFPAADPLPLTKLRVVTDMEKQRRAGTLTEDKQLYSPEDASAIYRTAIAHGLGYGPKHRLHIPYQTMVAE